jgi:hypothetical protein
VALPELTAPAGAGFVVLKFRLIVWTGSAVGNTQLHMSNLQIEALDSGMSMPTGWGSDGTATLPGFSFFADQDNGFYRIGTNNWGRSVGGTLRETYSTTDTIETLPRRGADGTAAAPQLSFSGDTDNGLYRIGTNNPAMAAGGSLVHSWSVAGNTQPLQPAFLYRLNATVGDVTGTGTPYSLLSGSSPSCTWSSVFDRGANFSGGTFTAPAGVALGSYFLGFSLQLEELNTQTYEKIVVNLVTSNRTYQLYQSTGLSSIYETQTANGVLTVSGCVLADMDASDTAYIQLTIWGGGAAQVNISGTASTTLPLTTFYGWLAA